MIYLDSGATSLYRPREVYRVLEETLHLGNPGRGGHRLALEASKSLFAVREKLCTHFGLDDAAGVCFFYNATTALNVVLKTLVPPGGRVLISNMEHHAVRRPALALQKKGVTVDYFEGYGKKEEICASFQKKLGKHPDLAVFLISSNICPVTLPVKELCALCRKARVPSLLDAAQAAGHQPLSLRELQADGMVVPSHKGLLGIAGAGALLAGGPLRKALEDRETLLEGGSGIRSFDSGMPEELPERLEWGTPALPAIASLGAGVEYLEKTGYEEISSRISALNARCREGIGNIKGLQLRGMEYNPPKGQESGCLLFTCGGREQPLAQRLYDRGICLREGFHCAPLAHDRIGTGKTGGLRVSFSLFNRPEQIDRFLEILNQCVREMDADSSRRED